MRALTPGTRRAVALAALGMVSAGWTATLLSPSSLTPLAQATPPPALPGGDLLPSQPLRAPASVSPSFGSGMGWAPGLPSGQAGPTLSLGTVAVDGIPAAALAAYQRAETVINIADPSCHLTWQLVAAIGRVESDHGRYSGSVLTDDGVATPAVYGLRLDGDHGTSAVSDTDDGRLDHDPRWDRAVGPLQFIPSTWRVVGVDADGDGARDPQDIDDAALASAVYLCSGTQAPGTDLSTTTGQKRAVYRYHRSWSYVALVLEVMEAYASGDYASVPTSAVAGTTIGRDPAYDAPGPGRDGDRPPPAEFAPAPEPSPVPAEETPEEPTPSSPPEDGPRHDLPTTGIGLLDDALAQVSDLVSCVLEQVPPMTADEACTPTGVGE